MKINEKIYLKDFLDSLLEIFLISFWNVPNSIKSKWINRFSVYLNVKKYIEKKEYMIISDEDCYILLNRNGIHLAVINKDTLSFTRIIGSNKIDKTFLLNTNKTAKYILNVYANVQRFLKKRELLYKTINECYVKLGEKYIESDEFLLHLHNLSYGNYYDIIELKNNFNYTNKEKSKFLGDYCDFSPVNITYFHTFEEIERMDLESLEVEDFNHLCSWTDDIVPSALSINSIDSIICINPSKIHGITLNKKILQRMKKKYFNF